MEIEEKIERENEPKELELYGIYDDGELIYKEKVQDVLTVRLKLVGIRKYCFNPNSILSSYFFLNQNSRYLFFFRKFTMCRHSFSCFEFFIKNTFKSLGGYLILRTVLKLVFED